MARSSRLSKAKTNLLRQKKTTLSLRRSRRTRRICQASSMLQHQAMMTSRDTIASLAPPEPTGTGSMGTISPGRHDGRRCAQRKAHIAVARVINAILHLKLVRQVRPVSDHGHHPVLLDTGYPRRVRKVMRICDL